MWNLSSFVLKGNDNFFHEPVVDRGKTMRMTLLTVDADRTGVFTEGQNDYLTRIRRFCKFEIKRMNGQKLGPNAVEETVRRKDWESVTRLMPARKHLILLDQRGKMMTSEKFAKSIQEFQSRSVEEVVFAIGGPIGFPEEALRDADTILSLSPMTFTHDLARLILLEQIYRSFMILRGGKYHK
jgi:23S rRNA (pseudouridine1915-N3)-methyltransferase